MSLFPLITFMNPQIKINFKQVLKKLHQKPVLYYPAHAKIMGSVSGGVLLSQLLYWWSNIEGDEFWHTNEELQKETGLSAAEIKVNKKKLIELGIFEIEQREINKENKWYRVSFYKFKPEKYLELLSGLLPEWEELNHPGGLNSTTRVGEILPPIENNREYIENINNIRESLTRVGGNQHQLTKTSQISNSSISSQLKEKTFICVNCRKTLVKSPQTSVEIAPNVFRCVDCQNSISNIRSLKKKLNDKTEMVNAEEKSEINVEISQEERKQKKKKKKEEFTIWDIKF
ncbi:MAG: hypothetical protein KatS3mg096_724 [Candidatus Parcubacteria bacterium]|nr:MAG: hypothetical protein KatS3mg096_724 [Candidatus Parcubacteria bacterium]